MNEELKPRLYNKDLPNHIDYPNVPIGTILKGNVRRYGNRTAYIYRNQSITFNQLHQESLRMANSLRKMGVTKQTVVSTHLPTCPQYVIAYYGIILAGATYSPVNPALPPEELVYQLNDCNARIILTYDTTAKSLEKVLERTAVEKVIVTGDQEIFTNDDPVEMAEYADNWFSFAALQASSSLEEFEADIDPLKDIAHIAYTGGTTGRAKGVMISHSNLISNILQCAAWSSGSLPYMEDNGLIINPVETDQAKYLAEYATLPGTGIRISPAPLFHGAGVIGSIVYPTLMGTTTILIDRFDPEKFLDDIEKYRVTEMSGAPAMFNFLLRQPDIEKRDLSSIKIINSGAAPLVSEVLKLLQHHFPEALVTEGYGLTESTATAVLSISFKSGLRKLGTVGLPVYDTEVKVVDISGNSMEALPVNQSGEVCIRGPQVMLGYYNNQKETEETLKDGWLRTGDIGMFDDDGFLSIVDRKKDMLIYNGYNVYPRKLEELLFEHPAVSNAVVVGKPKSDVGEIPKAYVILKPGMLVSETEILDFVNNQVVHYSKIRELEFIKEMPMTAAGKILKRALQGAETKN